jgi:hypothetical protein
MAMVGAAVAASVVVLVALAASSPTPVSRVRTVALIGPGPATATASLTARSWGTAVTLTERGLQAGGIYTVSMRTSSGSWWATGSIRAVPGVDAQMTCGVPLSQITGVRVTNSSGATVLWSESASVPHW